MRALADVAGPSGRRHVRRAWEASDVRALPRRSPKDHKLLQSAQHGPAPAVLSASDADLDRRLTAMPALRAAAAAWVGWAALLSGKDDLFNLPHLNRATVAGISVAIAGNVLISLALNCQKLAHRRLELQRSGTTQEADRRAGDGRSAINGGNALGITEEEDTELAGMEDASSPLNGQEVVDEDESFSSAPAVLETAPLLSSGQGTPIYGSHEDGLSTKDRKPPWSSRLFIWRKRARKFASDAEHAHLGTTHSLVPVDVVAARPKGPRRESSGQDDKADEHRNEGDYLKSKLWYANNSWASLHVPIIERPRLF